MPAGSTCRQAMIAQAQAAVESAEADLNRTQQDYKRYAALMASDFASRQRFEQAQADARKADSRGCRGPAPRSPRQQSQLRRAALAAPRRRQRGCSRRAPICGLPRTISTTR